MVGAKERRLQVEGKVIRRGKVGKGVVDVGSAVSFDRGELGFGRWECRHISILCMAAAAAGV